MPKTSIIIRTLNEEKHLGNLLNSIKAQKYQDYEIIIVDSGSTDRTLKIAEKFNTKIIKIKSSDFTFGYSLNIGCEESSGEYLVFASAHVLPTDDKWLSNLLNPFNNKKVAMVYGRQIGSDESKFSEKVDFKRLFGKSKINSNVPLNYANNANSAIRKELWEKNKFDEYLFGLEDIDWAKKMSKNNYFIYYEPEAVVYHIHEEEWYQVFNRYRRESIAAIRIGLEGPPQAKLGILWMLLYVVIDFLYSFPNYTLGRLEEVLRFRYYQWKGSLVGWKQGKNLNLDVERESIFNPIKNAAVVIKSKNNARFEEVEIPKMKPGDILIKVDYVGVCRTDLEVHEGTLGYYRDGLARYPIIPGHEFSGTIVRVGSNNKLQERFKVGEKIVVECIHSRGEVSDRKEVGVINQNGAYSQFLVVPGIFAHKVPENLDQKTAALTEPLAVVLRALRRVKLRLSNNSKVAVIGAGQIGNLCTQVLSLRGYRVALYDKDERRLSLLKNKATEGTSTELNNLDEFDVIIEATGSVQALEKVLKISRFDGTILLLGFPYGDMKYNFEDFVGNEKVIIGSVGSEKEDFIEALEVLPQLNMDEYIKFVMPLKDFDKAWSIHGQLEKLKILLKP